MTKRKPEGEKKKRGPPVPAFDVDGDRYSVAMALAIQELLGCKKHRAFMTVATMSLPGQITLDFLPDGHVHFTVKRVFRRGAPTSPAVRAKKLKRRWASWQKFPALVDKIVVLKGIIMLLYAEYDNEQARHDAVFEAGKAANEKVWALSLFLAYDGYFDEEFKLKNAAWLKEYYQESISLHL